jgi:hypothetical protein
VVRHRRVRPGGDARLEGHALGAARAHERLEEPGRFGLGHARPQLAVERLHRLVGQLGRPSDRRELARVLDRPEREDRVVDRHELDRVVAERLPELLVVAEGEPALVEADPLPPGRPDLLGEQLVYPLRRPRRDDVDAVGLGAGGAFVQERRHQHRPLRTEQDPAGVGRRRGVVRRDAAQPTPVLGTADQQRVAVGARQRRARLRQPLRAHAPSDRLTRSAPAAARRARPA